MIGSPEVGSGLPRSVGWAVRSGMVRPGRVPAEWDPRTGVGSHPRSILGPMAAYRVCARCVMDTSVPDIRFAAAGVCSYCRAGDRILATLPPESDGERRLLPLIARAKELGRGREYDVIVGVSGGVDSSYACVLASRHGLRALAVHFDNGWNSELAVENIQRVVEGCGFDLMTYVIAWPEFRDLQRAFLKASVIDIEMITDHAI